MDINYAALLPELAGDRWSFGVTCHWVCFVMHVVIVLACVMFVRVIICVTKAGHRWIYEARYVAMQSAGHLTEVSGVW
jgi:hypothetical protein